MPATLLGDSCPDPCPRPPVKARQSCPHAPQSCPVGAGLLPAAGHSLARRRSGSPDRPTVT